MLTKLGTAQIKTVMTNAATGTQSIETAYANQRGATRFGEKTQTLRSVFRRMLSSRAMSIARR